MTLTTHALAQPDLTPRRDLAWSGVNSQTQPDQPRSGQAQLSQAPPDQIDVCIVDDHPLYRIGLAWCLSEEPGVRVGVMAGSVEEFLAWRRTAGQVVLLDLDLPGTAGPAAVVAVTAAGHRVLVISAGPELVRPAMSAGARGYLTKDTEPTVVAQAVRAVAAGGRYVAPHLAAALFDGDGTTGLVGGAGLTRREKEVLARVAGGDRDRDIADALRINLSTVRSHLDRIRDKTNCRRRSELTRYAISLGLSVS